MCIRDRDRILFATDYPFAGAVGSIAQCREAFGDDPVLLDKVFYRNAARILHL